jgi:hypothetical protein
LFADAWLRAEQDKRDKEIARRRAEQERLEAEKRKQEQAALTAAAKGKEPPPEEKPLPLPAAPPIEEKVRIGGATGKRLSLRTRTVVDVIDHKKALKYFAENDEVKALVKKLATAAVLAGNPVPGTKAREESFAA